MDINERFEELLNLYVDGQLTGSDAEEFERLCVEDESLRLRAEEERRLVALFHEAPKAKAPAGLMDAVMAEVTAEARVIDLAEEASPERVARRRSRTLIYTFAAAALLLVGAFSIVMFRPTEETPQDRAQVAMMKKGSEPAAKMVALAEKSEPTKEAAPASEAPLPEQSRPNSRFAPQVNGFAAPEGSAGVDFFLSRKSKDSEERDQDADTTVMAGRPAPGEKAVAWALNSPQPVADSTIQETEIGAAETTEFFGGTSGPAPAEDSYAYGTFYDQMERSDNAPQPAAESKTETAATPFIDARTGRAVDMPQERKKVATQAHYEVASAEPGGYGYGYWGPEPVGRQAAMLAFYSAESDMLSEAAMQESVTGAARELAEPVTLDQIMEGRGATLVALNLGREEAFGLPELKEQAGPTSRTPAKSFAPTFERRGLVSSGSSKTSPKSPSRNANAVLGDEHAESPRYDVFEFKSREQARATLNYLRDSVPEAAVRWNLVAANVVTEDDGRARLLLPVLVPVTPSPSQTSAPR